MVFLQFKIGLRQFHAELRGNNRPHVAKMCRDRLDTKVWIVRPRRTQAGSVKRVYQALRRFASKHHSWTTLVPVVSNVGTEFHDHWLGDTAAVLMRTVVDHCQVDVSTPVHHFGMKV